MGGEMLSMRHWVHHAHHTAGTTGRSAASIAMIAVARRRHRGSLSAVLLLQPRHGTRGDPTWEWCVSIPERWRATLAHRVHVHMRLRLVLWREAIWPDLERAGLPVVPIEPICGRSLSDRVCCVQAKKGD